MADKKVAIEMLKKPPSGSFYSEDIKLFAFAMITSADTITLKPCFEQNQASIYPSKLSPDLLLLMLPHFF